ncbi:MAG: CBS domain-containing protein [Firmicutes bacterium]|nr:CBS domain-containing protein [Bacillota bacterium]
MKNILVKEMMTSPVVSVKHDMSLKELVKILDDNIFSGLPVIDEKEKIIGIISEKDVMKYTQWIIGQPLKDPVKILEDDNEATYVTGQRGVDVIELVASATAETIMTQEVVIVSEETPVLEIVRLMNRKEINRIPVTDETGKLKGIVTRADILKMLERWADNRS